MKINIEQVHQRIAMAAQKCGKQPDEITLIAVSKTMPPEAVERAISLGLTDFGENYIQEGIEKANTFRTTGIWHFIGHLQSNKAKLAVEHFNMIQSVDSIDLINKINTLSANSNKKMDILLEIHYGDEASKTGFSMQEIEQAVPLISSLQNINIKGLMTIPPLVNNPEDNRKYFKAMRKLGQQIFGSQKHILSMGMTDDFEIAIEEGSNMVRIGRAIFGERAKREN